MPDFVSKLLGKSIRNIRHWLFRAAKSSGMNNSLFDARGRRKYLLPIERRRFLQAALDAKGKTASFCATLALSGARISEVLALTPNRIDVANCAISFETLKQRRRGSIRAVPVPRELIHFLEGVHRLSKARAESALADEKLWTWSRTTAWRRVKFIMQKAAAPTYASQPKALRHAFGVEATMEGITLAMVQRWLGHADIRTTTIYTTVIGKEERTLARRMSKRLSELLRR